MKKIFYFIIRKIFIVLITIETISVIICCEYKKKTSTKEKSVITSTINTPLLKRGDIYYLKIDSSKVVILDDFSLYDRDNKIRVRHINDNGDYEELVIYKEELIK